jgi:DNA-binding NarL/FixJ family response regulator
VPRLRILILDADEVWRGGLRRLIEEQPDWELSGEASSVEHAVKMMIARTPDVVAMDAALPAGTVETLRQARPETAVLAVGAIDRDEAVEAVIRAGARGFITKSDPPETICQAVETVSRDRVFLSPRASEVVLDRFLGVSSADDVLSRMRELTPRERDIVRLLADGMSSRELARKLSVSVKTIENHRANAMRKLGTHSVGDVVRAAIRAGVIESKPADNGPDP